MSFIPADIAKAIQANKLDKVVFRDPFSSTTRAVKRNLLVASFAAILVSALGFKITGFLGLGSTCSALDGQIVQGLASVITIYFLVSFIFQAYIDYTAWRFESEVVLTKPYLDLITLYKSHYHAIGEQIANAMHYLHSEPMKSEARSNHWLQQAVDNSAGQLGSIAENTKSLHEEMSPLLESWSETIMGIGRLNLRKKARMISFWSLDVGFPLLVGAFAISATLTHVSAVWHKIIG